MALQVKKNVLPEVYENTEQARQRLRNSVVLYDGKPHYIINVGGYGDNGELRASMGELPFQIWRDCPTPIIRPLSDPLFNRFRPFETGFMNMFGVDEGSYQHTMFVSRRSVRQSSQGFNSQSYGCRLLAGSLGTRDGGSYERFVSCPEFTNMVVGKYPSFEESVDALINNSSVGFDKDYAVLKDSEGTVWLYRQLTKVGIITTGPNRVLLFRNRRYLREEIQENPNLPDIEMEI